MRCLHWLHACLTFIQWCLERLVQQGLLLNSWLIQLTLLSCKWVFMEIKRRRGRGRGSHVLALCFEWSSVNFSNVAGDVLFLNIKLGAPFINCYSLEFATGGMCCCRSLMPVLLSLFFSPKNREPVALIWEPSPLWRRKKAHFYWKGAHPIRRNAAKRLWSYKVGAFIIWTAHIWFKRHCGCSAFALLHFPRKLG